MTRNIKKAVVAGTLAEVQKKSADKFGKNETPKIHLDSDGTEIDDEDYFQTLEANTELIAVFEGEQWIDVSLCFFNESLKMYLTCRCFLGWQFFNECNQNFYTSRKIRFGELLERIRLIDSILF